MSATSQPHPGPLAGLRAVVTGAGSGIGAAITERLVADGACVMLAGRRLETLEATRAKLNPTLTACVALDVTSSTSIAAATKYLGTIDILVNNAGQASSAPFLGTDTAALDAMLDVNFKGTWHMSQAMLPHMVQRGHGRIINVASTAGLVGYGYVAAYVAAKHAVIGLTRALALEVARHGVTVNAVCPGFTETPLLDGAIATITEKTGRSAADARAELARANPMRRLVQPREVADTVAWLASPGAAAITGQAIAVAGGEVMTG